MTQNKSAHTNQSISFKSRNSRRVIKSSFKKGSSQAQELIKFGITGGSALEIGPSQGCLGLEWLKSTDNSTLTGLEINPEMVKIAENNAVEYGFLNKRAKYTANITKMLPFADNAFDAVFSHDSLHEWSEPTVMLNEIQRVLKPGGRYYISELRRDLNPLFKYYQYLFNPVKFPARHSSPPTITCTEKEITLILAKTKMSGSKVTATSFRIVITGIKPQITRINAPIQVIGISTQTSSKKAAADIAQLNRRYLKENISQIIPNKKNPRVFIAVTRNFHPIKKTFTYMMGDQVTSLLGIPEGLIGFEIPALSYVVFTVRSKNSRDFPRAIHEMKNYIFEYWFPNSHYEKDPLAEEFELYDDRSKLPKNPEIDIYVPIK